MIGFVINLDNRSDRMESFKKNEFPFPVQRFSAYTGYCGEDGCTFSHLALLNSQLYMHDPFVIFEDDCVMLNPWSDVEKALEQLPEDWDALWLGANLRKPLKRHSKNLFRLTDAYGLHAVIYNSRRMIDFIVDNHNTPSGKNLDIFYRNTVLKKFKCFITYPIMATQLSDKSDIANVITHNFDEIVHNYNHFVK